MMKKGTSYVTWILLLTLMITLTVITAVWSQRFEEETLGGNIDFISGQMDCQSIKFTNEGITCPSGIPGDIKIKNRGALDIFQFALNEYPATPGTDPTLEITEEGVGAGEEKVLNINDASLSLGKIEVTPVVRSGKKLVGCKEKKITIDPIICLPP